MNLSATYAISKKKAKKSMHAIHGIVTGNRRPGIGFLLYHRVTGDLPYELDVPYPLFKRQIEYLCNTSQIVSYDSAVKMLKSSHTVTDHQYVLTFDDGFLDFYTHVYPLLEKLKIPATLFITTQFVDEHIPCIFSEKPEKRIEPVTWKMAAEMKDSGLVTIGSHTHSHEELKGISKEKIRNELERSKNLIKEKLGIAVKHFSYPRGKWDSKSELMVKQYCETAVIGGCSKCEPDSFDPYRILRIPICKSDGWYFFLAKVKGLMVREAGGYLASVGIG
jgi:hypothetical protein